MHAWLSLGVLQSKPEERLICTQKIYLGGGERDWEE